jgi:PAS domain S-box-containing protein
MSDQVLFSRGDVTRNARRLFSGPKPKWATESMGQALRLMLVAIGYYIAVLAGLKFRIGPSTLAIFWPANAVLVAALFSTAKRQWMWYLLAIIPVHIIAMGAVVADPKWIAYQLVHNAVLAAATAGLLLYLDPTALRFDRLRGASVFLAVAFAASGVSTIFMILPVVLLAPADVLVRHGWVGGTWFVWGRHWLADFVSILVFVPLISTWTSQGLGWLRRISLKRYAEGGLLALLVLSATLIAFGKAQDNRYLAPALFLAPLPLLLWAATRFGPRGASTAIAAVACISSWCAYKGVGPFALADSVDRVISIQFSWILLSVPLLLLVVGIQERKEAIWELSESEDRFRQLIRQASVGIVLESIEGGFVLVNPAFSSILGYPEKEMLQQSCHLLSHPDDLEAELPFIQELQNGQRSSYQIEKRFFHKSGAEVWAQVGISLLKGKNGTAPLVIGMVTDITARKTAEKELRASEARLASTLNVLVAEIAILDDSGFVIAANTSWQRLAEQTETGPHSAGVGANFLDACADTTGVESVAAREVAIQIQSLLRGDISQRPVVQHENTSEGESWHLVTMYRFEENGTPRIVLSYRDVTDLMRTKEELAQNQESLSLALEATHTVTWEWEFDSGKIRWVNKQYSSFAKQETESDYSEFVERIHPADRKRVSDFVDRAVIEGDSQTVEFRIPDAETGTRWILAKGKLFHDQAGRPAGMHGVNVDITELRQRDSEIHALVGRLIQAQEEERRRISRELHDDIAQRLSLLANEMGMMEQRLTSEGRHAETLQVNKFGQQVGELASDIHQISHDLHSSKLQHLGLRTALRDLCEKISEKHRIKCELHMESLEKDMPSDISLCLFRVTQEGLNNVIKHSGAKEVFVDVVQIHGKVLLTIKDCGIGFDTLAQSSGIGLTSMRERLRLVGGTFSVKSIPSEGTEIIGEVSVPGKAASAATAGSN